MFGYITPCVYGMRANDIDFYKAVYCGICKSIGRNMGQLPRYTLSFDSVFFALTLMLADPYEYTTVYNNCAVHPIKKLMMIYNSEAIDYIADINVLTAYFKSLDDCDDENSYKGRAIAGLLKPAVRRIRRRCEAEYDIIEEGVSKLKKLERENCDSLDMAAEPFSEMMARVMTLGWQTTCSIIKRGSGKETAGLLETIGYNIGKWLYYMDAFDDIEQDHTKGSYNAVLSQYQYGADREETFDEFRKRVFGNFEFVSTYTLSILSEALEKLFVVSRVTGDAAEDTADTKGIADSAETVYSDNPAENVIRNIIYAGLPERSQLILSGIKPPRVHRYHP